MFDDFKLPKMQEFEDLLTFPAEKTGIYDKDKGRYTQSLPNTKNPNMTNPFVLTDGDEYLGPGFYEVALSDDKRYLLLIQSRELKALVPAIKVVVKQQSDADLNKRQEVFEKEKKKFKKQNKRGSLKTLESQYANEEELDMSAKIYDSKKGYYIIEYNKKNVYAWGYVPK